MAYAKKPYPTATKKPTVVHACPGDGLSRMACCNRTPFEVPMDDQLTLNPDLVTCNKKRKGNNGSAAK